MPLACRVGTAHHPSDAVGNAHATRNKIDGKDSLTLGGPPAKRPSRRHLCYRPVKRRSEAANQRNLRKNERIKPETSETAPRFPSFRGAAKETARRFHSFLGDVKGTAAAVPITHPRRDGNGGGVPINPWEKDGNGVAVSFVPGLADGNGGAVSIVLRFRPPPQPSPGVPEEGIDCTRSVPWRYPFLRGASGEGKNARRRLLLPPPPVLRGRAGVGAVL